MANSIEEQEDSNQEAFHLIDRDEAVHAKGLVQDRSILFLHGLAVFNRWNQAQLELKGVAATTDPLAKDTAVQFPE